MTRRVFRYSGDINIEYGGFFYCLDTWKWDYVDVVRVTPASDAGGPDNVFWIEELTVSIPKGDKLADVLKTCGWIDETKKVTPAQRKAMIVEACVSYGCYDQHSSEMIRIGPPSPFFNFRVADRWEPEKVYRAGTSLRRLAREKC